MTDVGAAVGAVALVAAAFVLFVGAAALCYGFCAILWAAGEVAFRAMHAAVAQLLERMRWRR